MVRVINCQWDKLFIKPIFHIVEANGPILLALTTLRKIGIFQKHPRVFIHPIQIENQARYESCRGEDVLYATAKGQDFVSDAECIGLPEAGIMVITEECEE